MKPFRRNVMCALATSGLVAAAACGAGSDSSPDMPNRQSPGQTGSEAAPPAVPAVNESGDACPLSLPGTTSSIEDTVDGVVVVFATPRPGDAAELRRRVERLADAQNSTQAGTPQDMPAGAPQGPGPRASATGATDGGKLRATAAIEASAEDVRQVRLVLRPKDPAGVDAARDGLRKHADELVQGACKQAGRKTDH